MTACTVFLPTNIIRSSCKELLSAGQGPSRPKLEKERKTQRVSQRHTLRISFLTTSILQGEISYVELSLVGGGNVCESWLDYRSLARWCKEIERDVCIYVYTCMYLYLYMTYVSILICLPLSVSMTWDVQICLSSLYMYIYLSVPYLYTHTYIYMHIDASYLYM